MSLLHLLKLVPSSSDDNTAKPAALRRARLAARLRKGQQRAVLEAAIESAAQPGSNSAESLDIFVTDEANNAAPVSTMAPRGAYHEPEAGKGEDKGLAGRLKHNTGVVASEATGDPSIQTDFQVMATIEGRELVAKRLGHGERLYKRDAKTGMREPDGFKVPEELVMAHEHLHLMVSAHVAARVKEFADAAFGSTAFDKADRERLATLLVDLVGETEKIVNKWLDRVSIPDRPGEIGHAEALTEKLLGDGTLETRVRSALLSVVRKNARKLAAFRKG